MSLNDRVAIPRKTMVLFFLVDTSGSMSGEKIGSLNDAIRETVPDLNDLSINNADAAIKIAALSLLVISVLVKTTETNMVSSKQD